MTEFEAAIEGVDPSLKTAGLALKHAAQSSRWLGSARLRSCGIIGIIWLRSMGTDYRDRRFMPSSPLIESRGHSGMKPDRRQFAARGTAESQCSSACSVHSILDTFYLYTPTHHRWCCQSRPHTRNRKLCQGRSLFALIKSSLREESGTGHRYLTDLGA